ncbi:MAG: formyltransferase family protein [Steroidobacteraceae bacterium]|jgi:phosphoribosylglycinamide formyltransferase-1
MKVVVIASTNGGILSALLKNAYAKPRIAEVVSDRQCGAIDVARSSGVRTEVYPTLDGGEFSEFLLRRYSGDRIDLFLSFYTRLFGGQFLNVAENKLVNVHPSILPACPGPRGFEDTIESKSRFIGATVHFVDAGVDTGAPIIQAAVPFDPGRSLAENRHKVFVVQYKMALQVIKWFDEGRVVADRQRDVQVRGATYLDGVFSPNLDAEFASIEQPIP